MSNRYDLAQRFDQLRRQLAKAERSLSLSKPLRSSHLYDIAIAHLDQAIQEIETVMKDNAER